MDGGSIPRAIGAPTLMAVLAHPDDESLGFGGTLAAYAARGVDVHLLTATRGEAGRYHHFRRGEAGHPGSAPRADSPANRTSRTVRVSPGDQRSVAPAGMSRRNPRAASRSKTSRALTRSNG